MNKTNLIKKVSEIVDITKNDANIIVSAVVDSIIEGLCEDGKVTLSGLGSFNIVTRGPRTARNPKTGESVAVPEKEIVKFKMSSLLKERLN